MKKIKKTPKRFLPKGLKIIYEDPDILVVDKEAGLLTIGTNKERVKTAYARLDNYVKKGNYKSRKRIYIVHRLDRDTSGVIVFAKTEKSKRFLQDNWQEFDKRYTAIVHGRLKEKEGCISSFLAQNKVYRMYSTQNQEKGKFSKTGYKVIRESKDLSLLEIQLFTGRKNQIRVHLSEKNHPVVGDKVYGNGKKSKRLALHSTSLTIIHPFSKEKMTFEAKIPAFFHSIIPQKMRS